MPFAGILGKGLVSLGVIFFERGVKVVKEFKEFKEFSGLHLYHP